MFLDPTILLLEVRIIPMGILLNLTRSLNKDRHWNSQRYLTDPQIFTVKGHCQVTLLDL